MSTDLHTALEAAITARLEVARAATPGPWKARTTHPQSVVSPDWHLDADARDEDVWLISTTLTNRPTEDAMFVALHDPDDAVRRYERDLKALRRHVPFEQPNWSLARGSFTEPGCEHCELTSNDGDPLAREWPCDEITDLLDVYPEVTL